MLVLPNGVAPSNKVIVELIDIVKPLIRGLVEDANLVRISIFNYHLIIIISAVKNVDSIFDSSD